MIIDGLVKVNDLPIEIVKTIKQEKDLYEFECNGYPCLIVRKRSGCLNGYVGLGEYSKYYLENYRDIPVTCHGGLTYASHRNPVTSEEDTLWWIGFDTAHAGDYVPIALFRDGVYRDYGYVKGEVEWLCKQMRDIDGYLIELNKG